MLVTRQVLETNRGLAKCLAWTIQQGQKKEEKEKIRKKSLNYNLNHRAIQKYVLLSIYKI
jgi:hypothetical protein